MIRDGRTCAGKLRKILSPLDSSNGSWKVGRFIRQAISFLLCSLQLDGVVENFRLSICRMVCRGGHTCFGLNSHQRSVKSMGVPYDVLPGYSSFNRTRSHSQGLHSNFQQHLEMHTKTTSPKLRYFKDLITVSYCHVFEVSCWLKR